MTISDTLIAEGSNTTDATAQQSGTKTDAVITAAADASKTQTQADGKPAPKDGETAPDPKTADVAKPEQKDGETKTDDPNAKKDEPKKDGDEPKKEGPPEKYEDFKMPEGQTMDPKVLGEFQNVAKELGLNQEQAQKLAEFGPKIADVVAGKTTQIIETAKVDWHKQSMADKEFGGEKYHENLAVAKRALDNFGSPELVTLLKETGLQMHPAVVRLFYKAGKTISEDSIVNGGNTDKTEPKSAADILYGKKT